MKKSWHTLMHSHLHSGRDSPSKHFISSCLHQFCRAALGGVSKGSASYQQAKCHVWHHVRDLGSSQSCNRGCRCTGCVTLGTWSPMELRSMELLTPEDGQHYVRSNRLKPFTQRRSVSCRKTRNPARNIPHTVYNAALQSSSWEIRDSQCDDTVQCFGGTHCLHLQGLPEIFPTQFTTQRCKVVPKRFGILSAMTPCSVSEEHTASIFRVYNGSSAFLRNVCTNVAAHAVSQPKCPQFTIPVFN